MKISSVTIAILSSVLLGLPAAVSGQERFDMVSIFPIDGISVEDRCSPIELRKLRDHTQLALNAVMMMNHDQVGDLHYNEGMDVDEYFGGDASNRQLEQVPTGYQWAVFLCGCTYRRAIYDPDRPRCHGQEGGGVDLALFWNVLGIWVSLCITVAITGRMVVVVGDAVCAASATRCLAIPRLTNLAASWQPMVLRWTCTKKPLNEFLNPVGEET